VPVTLTVVNGTGCGFTLSSSNTTLTNAVASSGTPVDAGGSFNVIPNGGAACTSANTWNAVSSAPWLQVVAGATGNGSVTSGVTFNAFANTNSSARTATITAAGKIFTVTQPASPAALLNREVTALYQTFLGREPDAGGYSFWTGIGAPKDSAGNVLLGTMVDNFVTSPEGVGTDFAVMTVYKTVLNRAPSFNEWLTAVTAVRNGTVPAAQLMTNLLNSTEFATNFGSPNINSNLVTNLYLHALGRGPNSTELSNAASVTAATSYAFFLNYSATNGSSSGVFSATTEYKNTTNPLYIGELYFGILGRDSDVGGFNFWVGIANNGGPGILFNGPQSTRLAIMGTSIGSLGFVFAPEFQNRFQ